MISPATPADFEAVYLTINKAAHAYSGLYFPINPIQDFRTERSSRTNV